MNNIALSLANHNVDILRSSDKVHYPTNYHLTFNILIIYLFITRPILYAASVQTGVYLFKINNENTRIICEI